MEARQFQVWRIWGYEIVVQPKELMTSRVLRLVWGLALSCCNKTLDISKGSRTLAFNFLMYRCKHLNWLLLLWTWSLPVSHQTYPRTQSPSLLSFFENWDLSFFERGEVGWRHSIDALFDSGLKWWTQVSSPVTICCKKVLSLWQYSRSSEQASRRDCLWASMSCLGTYLTHTFEYPRVSMIFTALPALTPNDSTSSLIVMRLFSLINASAWTKIAFSRFFLFIIISLHPPRHCAVVYRTVIIHLL